MPFVAFVNAADRLTNHEADIIVEALRIQAIEEFSGLWPGIEIFPPIFVEHEQGLPQGAYPIVFVNDPDAADVAAYHAVDRGGKYYGHVFVNLLLNRGSGGIFNEVSRGASHEYFELLGNPTCCRYVDGPPTEQGSRYCFEMADPVQDNAYTKSLVRGGDTYEVRVSDLVGPGYFGQSGPLSITGAPKGPFKVADRGYQVIADEHGNDHSVFGLGAEHPPNQIKRANERHSRVVRMRAGRPLETVDAARLARPR